MMKISPKTVLKLISYWPPYLFSGIKVESFNEELTSITVSLTMKPWTRNYFGTHFGGSLYSMCDPFYVFLLSEHLRKEHIIWDQAAEIEFIKAVSEPVYATFSINLDEVEKMKKDALEQFNLKPFFETKVTTKDGVIVAKVIKKLYLRRKDAKERFKEKTTTAKDSQQI